MILRNRDVSILGGSPWAVPRRPEAVLALHRFGMGPRPGSIAAIAADPRGALDRRARASARLPGGCRRPAVEREGLPHRGRCQCEAAGQGDRGQARRGPGETAADADAPPAMAASRRAGPERDGGQDRRRSRSRSGPADLSRGGEAPHRGGARRRDRIRRAAGLVLVQPFLHLGRQDPEHVRRL